MEDKITADEIAVLIDTWWNVNLNTTRLMSINHLSFNRYMVECESHKIRLALYDT